MTEAIGTARIFVHPDGRMDRKNAAIYLGFAPKTLADWATKGTGPKYVMVGGRVFYFREDIDAWIGSQPRSPGSSRPELRSA
jgi:predicted DNA-binding transcriptional regulator AlpA